MTTQNKENYGRDVRNFHHPEDDMKSASDITNQDFGNESYVNQYERDDDEEIVNQDDDIVNNEDDDELNNRFSNSVETEAENDFNEDDGDDNLEEDYDENDRYNNDFVTDNIIKDPLDLEYDIDQDLEETDPVNKPRSFKY
jgi:hypothetical protein